MKNLATLSVCSTLFTACASQTFTVFQPQRPNVTPIVDSLAPTPSIGPIGTDSDGAATWGFQVVISQEYSFPLEGGSVVTAYHPVEPYTLTGEVVAGSTKYEYQIGNPAEGYRRIQRCHFTATDDPNGVCVDIYEATGTAPEDLPGRPTQTFTGPVRAVDTVAVTSGSGSPTSSGTPAENGARTSHARSLLIMGLAFFAIALV